MKKTIIRSIALTVLVAAMLLMTACSPYGRAQDTTTPDPNIGSEELQPLVVQSASVLSVNMLAPIVCAYHAGASKLMLADEMEVAVTAYRTENGAQIELDPSQYSFEIDDDGYVRVTCAEIGEVRIAVTAKSTGETKEVTVPVVRRALTVWDIIMLGIGLYALLLGMTGKGRIYDERYIKEGLEARYHTVVRICCMVVALLLIGSGLIAAVDAYGKYSLIKNITYGVAVISIIIALVVTGSMTDKAAKKEAQEKAMSGRDLKAPKAAFVFDDDEPTVDDIKHK